MDNPTEDAGAGLPATLDASARVSVPALPRDGLTLLDAPSFERALKLAELMASAKGLPGFYNSSPGTCLAAIEDGLRLGISPFVVARMSYQAHPSSPLAYFGKFVAAIINAHPSIDGDLDYEHFGPWEKVRGKFAVKESQKKKDEHGNASKYITRNWSDADEEGVGVRVSGTIKATGQVKTLEIYLSQCWPRNSTLWAGQPDQQICYIGARRWADRHAPHILMGINLAEEMPGPDMIEVNPEDRGPGDAAPTQRPTGTRLDQFKQLHGPKPDASADKPEPATQPAQDAPGAPTAREQGRLGLASDRAPAGSGAPAAGHSQQPADDQPRSPTMVDVFLPGQSAGESLPVGSASAFLTREAQGKPAEWLRELLKVNPWVARHKVTREVIEGLIRELEDGAGQDGGR